MDISKIQTLIAQGKVITDVTQIDPDQAYVQIGVYQPNNRKIGSAVETYPSFVIALSELTSGGEWGTITGVLAAQLDLQAALDAKYDITNPDSFIDITALAPYQLALGFTPEDVANKDIDGTLSANSNTLYSSQRAVKTYVDSSVVGVLDDRGNWDASSGLFPSTGGSGPLGSILKGDLWFVDVPGILGGNPVVVGSNFRALIDNPINPADWNILNSGLGYIPQNIIQKDQPGGYPSLDLTGKVPASQIRYKTLHTHGFAASTLGATSSRYYVIGQQLSQVITSFFTAANPGITNTKNSGLIPKTGIITEAKISWTLTGGTSNLNFAFTFRNKTTGLISLITNAVAIGGVSVFSKTFIVTGLTIPVTENDSVFTVIQSPAIPASPIGQTPVGVTMIIDYIIE
jgi:hypothetical protein